MMQCWTCVVRPFGRYRCVRRSGQQPAGKDLGLDLDLSRGQVRKVNHDWVETVQAGMERDPPKVLDMIVCGRNRVCV